MVQIRCTLDKNSQVQSSHKIFPLCFVREFFKGTLRPCRIKQEGAVNLSLGGGAGQQLMARMEPVADTSEFQNSKIEKF